MTYEEIMKISNIEEKQQKLIEFYKNEIDIEDWLVDKSETQKIRFKDRWEYKMNGVYHRLTGPAIDYNNDTTDYYYIFGEMMDETTWKLLAQKLLREKKLKRTLNID